MKGKILPSMREIELPDAFSTPVREDLIWKATITGIKKQPYGTYPLAGKQSSSGKQRHARRRWKSLYGRGISRIPRKYLIKKGEFYYMVGTFIPGTRGGRAAHPPKPIRKEKKMNKKEKLLALKAAIAATASKEWLEKKYKKIKIKCELPLIIDSSLLEKKNKDFVKTLSEIIGIEIKRKRKIRAGKGKMRGRKYKKSYSLLLVLGKEEKKDLRNYGIETVQADKLSVKHLASGGVPGRLTCYTEKAIKDLGERLK
ncbi:MAG: 50S ribosomal protein L4 [Candidatus Pacearchaeota archaeon]|nr:50S ribosomal protein L4 [Candidatus Pacearchaeota archaeon]